MTAQVVARSIRAMNTDKTYRWTGLGRWLALAAAAGMVLFSIPLIVSNVAADFIGAAIEGVFCAVIAVAASQLDHQKAAADRS